MRMPALPQTAFSIVRRDIAEAREGQHVAELESAKLRRAIEVAIERLGVEPRDRVRVRIERAVVGLRAALSG